MSPVDVFWDRSEGAIRFGVNDCCMVVADVVLAAGGPDLMAAYRGRYKTARGFVRAFRRAGHKDLRAACQAAFVGNGRRVQSPGNFDVTVLTHFDRTQGRVVTSPAVFIDGVWCFRTDAGGAAILPSAFKDEPPAIYRVI